MAHPLFHFGLLAAAALLSTSVFAQSGTPSGASPGKGMSVVPEACRKAAQASQTGKTMQMGGGQGGMPMDNMPEANRGYMEAMREMNPPMMMGMSITDPDLAFICSMIPHHQGAVDMAKAALKNAKDPDVRKMAERTIKEQGKEIEEMSRMAEKHAK